MKEKLLKYLSKYTVVTAELEEAIAKTTLIQEFKKGSMLLQAGSISRECYFVLKGCIRSYILKEGEEKTIEFYTEEQTVLPSSYGKNTPSEHYLECLEESIVSVGNPSLEQEAFQAYPVLATLSRAIGEVVLTQQQDAFADFRTSKPEERYLKLLENRPDLIQRVPNYQIASYLGIKPESLSRIRKRIVTKK